MDNKEQEEWKQKFIRYQMDGLADTIFKQGYDAFASGASSSSNPYKFDDDTSMQLIKLSVQKESLTEEQKVALQVLRQYMDGTEWSRWSRGFYCVNAIAEIHKLFNIEE